MSGSIELSRVTILFDGLISTMSDPFVLFYFSILTPIYLIKTLVQVKRTLNIFLFQSRFEPFKKIKGIGFLIWRRHAP
jgi:hypothetical protein